MKKRETIKSDVLAMIISKTTYKCAFCNYIKECERLEICNCKSGVKSWLETETENK